MLDYILNEVVSEHNKKTSFYSSPIQTLTVGVGFAPTPPLLFQVPGHGLTNFHLLTAGKEFHLAPKNISDYLSF